MRRLDLSVCDCYTNDTLFRLSSNSSNGLLFPKLESLFWNFYFTWTAVPFFPLFLSPHLQRVTLFIDLRGAPENLLTPTLQTISLLPTFLKYLSIVYCQGEEKPLDRKSVV